MTVTRWPRILWIVGTVLLVTMLVHVAAIPLTGGALLGPVSLRKPATFAETGWLVAWSVALLMPVLRMRAWQEHVVGATVALFGLVETAVMAVQAWRGVPSHYNFSSPLDAALVRGGAAGTAALFFVGVIVLLVATLRARIPADVRLGVVAGVLVLFVGAAVGMVMIFNNSGVYQGTIGVGFTEQVAAYRGPDAAIVGRELLLIRPETRGGDLVLPHAIGVHALTLLAVPAVLLSRTTATPRRRMLLTGTTVAAVVVAQAVLLANAFAVRPLSALGPVALAVLGLCAVALLGAYAATAARLWRDRPPLRPAGPPRSRRPAAV